jgi:plasmid stabilization system protein ParE
MSQVILAPAALRDLRELRDFLRSRHPAAAKPAAAAMIKSIQFLARHPLMVRPAEEMDSGYRELPIDFGDPGYIALYRYEDDTVTVLAVRHQKAAGY